MQEAIAGNPSSAAWTGDIKKRRACLPDMARRPPYWIVKFFYS